MVDRPTPRYFEVFGALVGVYLEDSWVLDVQEVQDSVTFRLDAVLTPEHELYGPPASGEQYCYRRGRMTVRSSQPMSLLRSDLPPAVDASGTVDYGNIDSFVPVDWEGKDAWELTGDWGQLLAVNPSVLVQFE
jgi:hypothetical protein